MRKEDVFRNYEEIVKLCKGDVDIANDVVIELTNGNYDNIELSYDVIQQAIKMIRCKRSRHCCDCKYNTKQIPNNGTRAELKYDEYINGTKVKTLNPEQIEGVVFGAFANDESIEHIAKKYELDTATIYGILYAFL